MGKNLTATQQLNLLTGGTGNSIGFNPSGGGYIDGSRLPDIDYSSIQNAFDAKEAEARVTYDQSKAKIGELYDLALQEYNSGKGTIDREAVTSEFKAGIQEQLTSISNTYSVQASREAERVDALVAGGALGGNAYRAYQAQSSVARDLMSQSIAKIAEISLSANTTLMSTYLDIDKANASVQSGQLQTIASIAMAEADMAMGFSQLMMTAEVESQKLMQNLLEMSINRDVAQLQLELANREIDVSIQLNAATNRNRKEVARIQKGKTFMSGIMNIPYDGPFLAH